MNIAFCNKKEASSTVYAELEWKCLFFSKPLNSLASSQWIVGVEGVCLFYPQLTTQAYVIWITSALISPAEMWRVDQCLKPPPPPPWSTLKLKLKLRSRIFYFSHSRSVCSICAVWLEDGQMSALASGKGILISYLCEPEQYGCSFNKGLVIVPRSQSTRTEWWRGLC